LRAEARDALIDLADREYRDPRTQAMKMITEALRQAGALPTDDRQLTTATPHGPGEAVQVR